MVNTVMCWKLCSMLSVTIHFNLCGLLQHMLGAARHTGPLPKVQITRTGWHWSHMCLCTQTGCQGYHRKSGGDKVEWLPWHTGICVATQGSAVPRYAVGNDYLAGSLHAFVPSAITCQRYDVGHPTLLTKHLDHVSHLLLHAQRICSGDAACSDV